MKILIVNTYDIHGGAARATYRLHKALLKHGIKSTMLVSKKESDDSTVISAHNNKVHICNVNYDNLPIKDYPNKDHTLFSSSFINTDDVLKQINSSDADIIHLHWIANGFLSITDIAKINKPILWTLHDNWAFTGGCHIMWDCNKYTIECGYCPRLNSDIKYDLSYEIFSKKLVTFRTMSNIIINGVSSWISNCAENSYLLRDKKIINLPNLIDMNIYKPQDDAREYFNLPKKKKIILFGAMSATSDINKGFHYLKKALKILKEDDVEFVVFGNNNEILQREFNYTVHGLGKIDSDYILAKLYSCADIMVVPSIQENLSNAIMESLSCKTPVVAFNIGGNKDLIKHKQNGYLVKPFDIYDLAYGIKWLLENNRNNLIGDNARKSIITNFEETIVVKRYISEYYNILKNKENSVRTVFNKYIYLKGFPCEYLETDLYNTVMSLSTNVEKYIIYGNGTISKTIKALIPDKIVGHVDIAEKDNHPQNLKTIKYDKIIISVLGREESIVKYLVEELNICEDKIVRFDI